MRILHILLLASLSATVAAQDSLLCRDYGFMLRQDAWLQTDNAASLTRLCHSGMAEAELTVNHDKGGLADFSGAQRSLQVDASVEALQRLNRRTVLYGSMGYSNFTGWDMTGSTLLFPSTTHHPSPITHHPSPTIQRLPFDIVEDSLTNAGRKHGDTYMLTGAVGIDIAQGYAVGLRVDYTAANYAKYKDLRHKNKLMDLSAAASVYAPLTQWLSLGAAYQYHRRTESVAFSTYGKNDKVYKSLIDYGAFFGRVEQFASSGYTDRSREMPLFEDAHGLSLQGSVAPCRQLTALASFSLSEGDGYYGRKSPYTITFTRHERSRRQTALSLCYMPDDGRDRLRLDMACGLEKLANMAETYREVTNTSGANSYDYYDPAETGDKRWDDVSALLTADLGIAEMLPAWTVSLGYSWHRRRQTAFLFPYYRRQIVRYGQLTAHATKNQPCLGGMLSVSLLASFSKGSGNPADDGTFVTPSDTQEPVATMEAFLMREYRLLTAPQYSVEAAAQYAFVMPGTALRTYLRLGVGHRKANATNEYCTGSDRLHLSLTAGCDF